MNVREIAAVLGLRPAKREDVRTLALMIRREMTDLQQRGL